MVNKQLKYFTRQRYNDSAYEQFDERGLESMKNKIMFKCTIPAYCHVERQDYVKANPFQFQSIYGSGDYRSNQFSRLADLI